MNDPSEGTPPPRNDSDPEVGPRLISRLSIPARKACHFAERQCIAEGNTVADPSHIFAGLLTLDQSESNGLRLLGELGIDIAALRNSLKNSGFIAGSFDKPPTSRPSLSLGQDFRLFLNDADSLAADLNEVRIGTEHFVLTFLLNPGTFGYRVLTGFGISIDAAKERLEQRRADGTYQPEPPSPDGLPVSLLYAGKPGLVFQVYQWTRLGYLLFFFLPFMATFLLNSSMAGFLTDYLGVMGPPIFVYIFPYIVSTYLLIYLIRIRAQKELMEMPASKSMVGLGPQFSACIVVGIFLALSVLPMFQALLFNKTIVSRHGIDIPALILSCLITLNCLTTVATHWLLTFNIRGKQFNFPKLRKKQ